VRDRNAESVTRLAVGERFAALREELRDALDSQVRIPWPSWHGERLYNFWRDAGNPRGVWRRTSLEAYRSEDPHWEVLLDLDRLARNEGENWVWQAPEMLRPAGRRCLIGLSRGGADAGVVREFDLDEAAFVPDGFALPEAKSWVHWIDVDRVFVATDFGPGSLTASGYPRVVREWRRGQPLLEAPVVFAAEPGDMTVYARRDRTGGYERDLVYRRVDFFRTVVFLRQPTGELVRIDAPEDADIGTHGAHILIRLRTPWTVDGRTHPAGALLAAPFDAYLSGHRSLSPLFSPDPRTSLVSYHRTRDHLILEELTDVRPRLRVLTPAGGSWSSADLDGPGSTDDHVEVLDTNPDHGNDFLLCSSGFTRPSTIWHGRVGDPGPASSGLRSAGSEATGATREDGAEGAPGPARAERAQSGTAPGPARAERAQSGTAPGPARAERAQSDTDPGPPVRLRSEPDRFHADGIEVGRHFAVSADGTRVPYLVVGPGGGPTLLSGYGGFEISMLPHYDPILGRAWLGRGGTFVLANIRGGGEYGPAWHDAALRERRPRAYQDFAAVARDLVARGVTTPDRLGIEGGSNGGLLTGVMLTSHPELFGAVVSAVPLMDMRRYHLLLAGSSWMAEYGDPDDPDDWAFLETYSPYHNVQDGHRYPPVLVQTSTRDDRVHPAHARKMVARLLEHGADVSYYENIEGGHAGAADNEQTAFMWALRFEFLHRVIGDGRLPD
jgi:prolyl oligopeptidase